MWKLDSPNRLYADPSVSLAISLIIFASAIPMSTSKNLFMEQHESLTFISGTPFLVIFSFTALKSGRILLEAAPLYLDLAKVKEDLIAVRTFFFLDR